MGTNNRMTFCFFKTSFIVFWVIVHCGFSVSAQNKTRIKLTNFQNETLKARMEQNASKLLTEFNIAYSEKRSPRYDKQVITDAAAPRVSKLWETSAFYCIETQIIEPVLLMPEGTFQVRNIPLYFKELSEDEREKEAVIVFDRNGKIDDIYIALELKSYQSFFKDTNSVIDIKRKQIILNFIEDFRTAYMRKDLGFIGSIFSDDALIIIGKEIKHVKTNLSENSFENKTVQYITKRKNQYMASLKRCFRRNEYIKLNFEDIEIEHHRKFDHIYGVTFKQHFNSPTYSDVGYLFLALDLRNIDSIIIHVRTWQPENTVTRKEDVFSIGDWIFTE